MNPRRSCTVSESDLVFRWREESVEAKNGGRGKSLLIGKWAGTGIRKGKKYGQS